MQADLPYIPEYITVHLGAPSAQAENVTIPFQQYIENVASSEIYPTWPANAIRANVYAQVSFALNRIYTEYYRSRGYDFDITNNTAYDQAFVNGREIFENVREIVGDIFNNYLRRSGSVEPLFAQYCNGTTVTCNGLSQWGTVTLANQGMTPFEILKYYFGDDIEIVRNTPIRGSTPTYPNIPLRLGSTGNDVRTIQIRLNRISNNYPSIPKIVLADGIFSTDTEAAVLEFQKIFNLTEDGVVGKSTWYAIQRIYNAVKRITELYAEGIDISEVSKEFPETISLGSEGFGVLVFQYFLNYLSAYYNTIPPITPDGIFGEATRAAVIDAQNTFGLVSDGIVGEYTWNTIYNAYLGIVRTVPIEYRAGVTIPFQGVFLRLGSELPEVRVLQEYLNYIANTYTEIPKVNVTGYFGSMTQEAVLTFQRLFGLEENGVVGIRTWTEITKVYEDLYNGSNLREGQYPGYELG